MPSIASAYVYRADEYIHRCLADAFGYKFANLIVEAARAPPERADVVKREHMKAIRTGQSLRNPKRYIGSSNGYLFDEDVWIEVSKLPKPLPNLSKVLKE